MPSAISEERKMADTQLNVKWEVKGPENLWLTVADLPALHLMPGSGDGSSEASRLLVSTKGLQQSINVIECLAWLRNEPVYYSALGSSITLMQYPPR